ncbi:hypothetical protein EDD11_006434 [Mortierella claussenii]|nr:hypothetical protein EDD11_006434 [Mortierella claussenii]
MSLANLPIQKQSTKIRKRLLADNQPNAFACDRLPSKRYKVLLDDLRSHAPVLTAVPSTLNVTPLHRTLSDKSSYLNHAALSELSADHKTPSSKAQSTLTSWRKESQSKRSGSESEDADDEEDVVAAQIVGSPAIDSTNVPETDAAQDVVVSQTPKNGPRLGLIDVAFGQASPTKSLLAPSPDDDLFGSDTTLTSPEDDSEDDVVNDGDALPGSSILHTTLPSDNTPQSNPTQVVPTLPVSIVKRKGPGRPRKTSSLVDTGNLLTRKRSTRSADGIAALFNRLPSASSPSKQTSLADLWRPVNLAAQSLPPASCTKQALPIVKTHGSLMARIIDGRKQTQVEYDTELSDSSDDADLGPLLRKIAQDKVDSQLTASINSLTDVVSASVTKEMAATVDPVLELALAAVTKELALATMLSPVNSKGHVFALPSVSTPRSSHATRSGGVSRPALYRTPSSSSRHIISKQGAHFRSTIRGPPRPRLFQTSIDIMTKSDSARPQSNVQSIKVILKHALEQGMRRMEETTDKSRLVSTSVAVVEVANVQTRAWGCVIGNGKGLFKHSTLKFEEQQQRMTERQIMVAEAYRVLNLPPPPKNWDKSSNLIISGLPLSDDPSSASAAAMKDALDHMSRRLGCEYCQKTYKNRNGLVYHMERCTMAQLQTSISSDMDGESTASETEDQRNARCPRANKTSRKYVSDESSNDECDDEEGIIMCVCGSKDDEGAMVQCDDCKVWLHIECLDLAEEDIPDEYFCPTCLGLPTPSTGGKSFRHVPTKSAKRKTDHRRPGRPRCRSRSEDSLSESELQKHNLAWTRHYLPNKIELRLESDSDSEADSSGTDEERDAVSDVLVSPQVVLNHDWEQSHGISTNDLEFDGDFEFKGKPAKTFFRQSRAPALMLDGSSSQESQAELVNPLLSNDLGLDDEGGIIFQTLGGEGLSGMGVELSSETDMSFHSSQPFDFLPSSTDSLFEPEFDDASPDLLTSEATVDSEGLRTPIDLQHGVDHSELWVCPDLESFVEEPNEAFDSTRTLNDEPKISRCVPGLDRYPTEDSLDWFCNAEAHPNDDFDLNGEKCLSR